MSLYELVKSLPASLDVTQRGSRPSEPTQDLQPLPQDVSVVAAETRQVERAAAVKLTLDDARQRLEEALGKLQTVPLSEVTRLTIDIQRLRVAVMTLSEAAEGKVNDKVYREMSLLLRMIKQVDLDDGAEADNDTRMRTAQEKLQEAGVTPAAARGLIEMFGRFGRDVSTDPEPDPGDLAGSE